MGLSLREKPIATFASRPVCYRTGFSDQRRMRGRRLLITREKFEIQLGYGRDCDRRGSGGASKHRGSVLRNIGLPRDDSLSLRAAAEETNAVSRKFGACVGVSDGARNKRRLMQMSIQRQGFLRPHGTYLFGLSTYRLGKYKKDCMDVVLPPEPPSVDQRFAHRIRASLLSTGI
jgi:hypothetical protein